MNWIAATLWILSAVLTRTALKNENRKVIIKNSLQFYAGIFVLILGVIFAIVHIIN